MTCIFCYGTLENGTTTHVTDINERAIIIRGVPCLKCNQCLEISYTGTVYEKLEVLLDTLKESVTEVAIVQYASVAA